MAVQTRNTLKGYFETGDTPTEAQFADLIDSLKSLSEDAEIIPTSGQPANGIGKDGDFAIDAATLTIYSKTAGTWNGGTSFQGPQGPQGAQGPAGNDGADGATGPQGPAGPQGDPGSGISWQGVWDSGTAYVQFDAVSYNGSSYVANAGSTNSIPGVGAEWDLWVAKGADGAQGPAGDDGAAGATGAQGPAGADGADGEGVPTGGTTGEYLRKQSGTNYDTAWVNIAQSDVTGLTDALDAKADDGHSHATSDLSDLVTTFLDATDDAAVITALGNATFTDNVATVSGFAQGRFHSDTDFLYVGTDADTVARFAISPTENSITVDTADPSGGSDGDIWLKVSA